MKDRADAAATRIADLSRAQKDHNTSISRVIANLYCGVTFADVVRELGQPEETFFDTGGACTFDVNKMRWAEFVLEGEYGGPCHGSVEEAERAILSKRVSTVQGKFGHGDTRYLCH